MSRVGKSPIKILQGVKVEFKDGLLKVEGPKGKLSYRVPEGILVDNDGKHITLSKVAGREEDKQLSSIFGTTRANLQNLMTGAHAGFQREMDIVGVGYKAALKGRVLTLNLGFSHQIDYEPPPGVSVAVEKNTHLTVSGPDKILVGLAADKIRSFRPPEPYQGKGVKYTDERIVRKVGKAAGAK
jgi:large subunit ribosomal protein L6